MKPLWIYLLDIPCFFVCLFVFFLMVNIQRKPGECRRKSHPPSPLRPEPRAEAPVWSRFPRHFWDPRPVAGRPRGGGGRTLRPRLRQSRGASARASRARFGHALALPSEHLPGEGVGEKRDERHRSPPGSETGAEREIPDPGLCDRLYSPAQPLYWGQWEEE